MRPRQNAPPAFPANASQPPCGIEAAGHRERKIMNDETEIQTIPAVLAEVQAQRYARLVRWMILGWVVSVAAFVAVIAWTL